MKKVLLTAMLGVSVILSSASDQLVRKCASNDLLQEQLASDPARAATLQQIENQTAAYILEQKKNGNIGTQAVVTIPVVFHVVYNTTAQNISDAKCIAQLNQLNLDYARLNTDAGNTPAAFSGLAANTQIQFCLAQRDPSGNATTGIIHKSTTSTSFSSNDNVKRSANGGDNAWDATKYLNIWTCNLSGGLLGYAQFPGGSASTDGVVVLYSSVGSMTSPGTASPYHLGRTATHEVGHWLNLYHIWGDESACNADDNVSDTPQQKAENYGCPTYPQTTQSGGRCSTSNPSSMFMNYMDYTDDACMNMFSAGQAARMQALFASGGARVAMVSSQGCTPPAGGGTCNVPSGQSTTGITTTTATLNWSAATGAVSYNLQYRIVGAGSWTSTTSTTTSKSLSGLVAATNYEWQVQTVCSAGSSAFSGSSTFTTSSTGGGCSDIYESNNTSGTAKTIAVNTDIQGLISSGTDVDWYKFVNTSAAPYIKITLTNLPADYDVKLYNSAVTQIGISENGGTTAETIKYNSTTVNTRYVQVYGYGGVFSTTQCYTLRASISGTAWRTVEDNEIILEDLQTNNFTMYPNPASSTLNINYLGEKSGTVTMKIMDIAGRQVMIQQFSSVEGVNHYKMNVDNLNKGVYLVELSNEANHSVQRLMLDK